MNAHNLFSKSVLLRELGLILTHVSFELDQSNVEIIDQERLRCLLQERWDKSSIISGVEVHVVLTDFYREIYVISVHLKDDPLPLVDMAVSLN